MWATRDLNEIAALAHTMHENQGLLFYERQTIEVLGDHRARDLRELKAGKVF